jgi:hypothetical protein
MKNNNLMRTGYFSVVLWLALTMISCGGGDGGGGAPVNQSPNSGADTTPDPFSFDPLANVSAGALVASAAVTVNGIEVPAQVEVTGGEYKIDNGVYTTTPGQINNGGRLTLRLQASVDAGGKSSMLVNVGGVTAVFEVTTQGVVLANKSVPSAQYATLALLLPSLVPGDIVDVRPLANGQAYPPVKFRTPGTPSQPIIIRGVRDNGKLPQIKGATDEVGGALKFQESDYVILDSFEITNGANALTPGVDPALRERATYCVSNQAHEVLIRHSRIFDCLNHGIIGNDEGSGSLTLDHVEVTGAGCDANKPGLKCQDDDIKHPVYVATDPDAHPGAVLRIQNSYFHDNIAGETIKTRAQRVEIYNNWIESKDNQTYKQDRALGLYGYDGASASLDSPINHDVVGNVIVVEGGGSMARFGGDDTGSTFGSTRFVNNTVLLGESYGDLNASQPVIRLDGELDALVAHNNIFQVGGNPTQRSVVLVRENNGLVWATGKPKILLTHNFVPDGSALLRIKGNPLPYTFGDTLPPGYTLESWVRAPSPGLTNDTTLSTPKLSLLPNSPLRLPNQLGTKNTNSGFPVTGALPQPVYNAPTVAPGLVQRGSPRADTATAPFLGAYD